MPGAYPVISSLLDTMSIVHDDSGHFCCIAADCSARALHTDLLHVGCISLFFISAVLRTKGLV